MNAKQLRNSILQMAIQGKLVPQDPNDEPASVLLDKIRQEKKRLVKEGVLKKKDLVETPICKEEKPFEIPNSWVWCRLGEIGIFERGNGIKRDETTSEGFPCIRYGEMYTKYRFSPTFKKTYSYTSMNVFNKCRKAHCGDLLMALTGENKQDIALAAQYIGKEEIAVGGDLCHFTILEAYALYFVYLINSFYFSNKKEILATGDIIVHISTDKLGSIAIPLPPLAEQHRIVAKLEEILPMVEEYGKAQEEADKLQAELPDKLRKSILQEAIQGKLVPQDPNDEPASILLDKIRQEKKRLVKEGKLKKKDLEETPISEDEKPFEIPDGWEWCRIGDVFTMQAGKNMPTGSIKKEQNQDNPYPCMGGNGIRGFVPNYNIEGVHAVMGRQGALCGNINLSPAIFYATEHAVVISNYAGTDLLWTYYSLTASNLNQYATATAQPGLSVANILNVLYPLPPLAEQHRIVAKIEELFNQINNNL